MDENKKIAQDILNILSKAEDAQMYGSVEIYLEAGTVTQITQRIIKKISKKTKNTTTSKKREETSSAPAVKYS